MSYQVFSDDSYSDEFYTVAGYIAPVAVWDEFGPKWSTVLKARPRLGFYRTSDALALKGPFDGWSESARNSRMGKLASVILDAGCYGVSAHLSRRDFEKFFAPNFLPVYADPYYLCATYLIGHTCLSFHRQATKIDFIFDRQGKVGRNFRIVFDAMMKPLLREVSSFLGGVRHESKRDFLPLQAADMHAAWVRRKESVIQLSTAADCYLERVPQVDYEVSRSFLEHLAKFRQEHAAEIKEFSESIERGDLAAAQPFMTDLAAKGKRIRRKLESGHGQSYSD